MLKFIYNAFLSIYIYKVYNWPIIFIYTDPTHPFVCWNVKPWPQYTNSAAGKDNCKLQPELDLFFLSLSTGTIACHHYARDPSLKPEWVHKTGRFVLALHARGRASHYADIITVKSSSVSLFLAHRTRISSDFILGLKLLSYLCYLNPGIGS